jgi:hypothetical protein
VKAQQFADTCSAPFTGHHLNTYFSRCFLASLLHDKSDCEALNHNSIGHVVFAQETDSHTPSLNARRSQFDRSATLGNISLN